MRLAYGIGAALAAVMLGQAAQAQSASVAEGRLSGTRDNGASVFLGVPYAAAPVGAGRWAPPRPPQSWKSVRAADKLPASCPQALTPDGFMMWTREYITPVEPGVNEDCLVANVWTPLPLDDKARPRARLPVLVFIHGGGYTSGSGTVPVYNGANLAKQGLVVVTINYRLGLLGFMAHPQLSAQQGGASGNYAIQDQIEALRWIKRNIAAFGGDPSRVTISGQSAGGGSVLALLAAPAAKGLFHGAIVQSAPGMGGWPPLANAEQAGAALVKGWGVDSIDAARALPLAKLTAPPGPGGGGAPIADGKVIPKTPQLASDVPVMTGYTFNDLFAQTRTLGVHEWQAEARQRYGDRAQEFLRYYPGDTDAQASASATRESVDRSELAPIVDWLGSRGTSSPVYAYLFSHVEPGPDATRYGAFHTSEVPYMFDTLHLSPGREFTAIDRQVVAQFSGAVVNFVKTGKPDGGPVPAWPALTREGKAVMEFGDAARLTRAYPQGADGVMAAGKPPAPASPFGAPSPPRAPAWPAVDDALRPLVEQGQLSGVVSLAVKDGKTLHASAIGQQDIASGTPMQMNSIFRAFSMTKPVTAVAMMILYDEGRWKPSDPVTRFLPELKGLKVFHGMDAKGKPILRAPKSMPTMAQLMTHTAGFGYGFLPGYVDDLYRANPPGNAQSADEFVRRLAALPLLYEPGTQWQYSVAMDVQGAIIERLTGMKLQDFMQARIFGPLGMRDTGFSVPAAKRALFATLYTWQDGKLAALTDGRFGSTYAQDPGFASGGGGLVTTAGDYARLGQMLLGDGELDGARVLKPGSAKIIMTDHLPAALVNGKFGIGMQQIRPGYQFGYNGVVVTDPTAAGVAMGKGSYLWDGAAGTWFWVDPSNNLVFVGMVQRLMSAGGMPNVQALSQQAVRQSLAN